MSENPLQALFHNFEQVSNFVQHHLSNFIGLHPQSSGTSGRGPIFSISSSSKAPLAKTTSSVHPGDTALKGKSATPVTKEELGRATWTFLHTLAAQFRSGTVVREVPAWWLQPVWCNLTRFGLSAGCVSLLLGFWSWLGARFWHRSGRRWLAPYPDNPTRQQKKDVKELVQIISRIYPCKECADHFKEVIRANPVQAGSHAEFSRWLCHVHNVVNRSLGKPVFPCERVDARWGKLECEQKECEIIGSTIFGKI